MELTLEQALQKGIETHKVGKVQEADRYYTAILKADPKHPDANHNMGVLAVGVDKVQESLPFFKTALEANAGIAQYWLSYIDALIKLDRLDDAKTVFDQAKSNGAKGDPFDQLEKKLGVSTSKNSDTQEPSQAQMKQLIALSNQGQFEKTLGEASRLLLEFPNSVDLYNITGASNKALGKLDEAVDAFKKAISIKPEFAVAHNNLGIVLQIQGKIEEAIVAYTTAGTAFKNQRELVLAKNIYKKILNIKPNYSDGHFNLGSILHLQHKFKDAIVAYQKAIDLNPLNVKAWVNGAEIREKWNKLDDLETWLEKAFGSFEVGPADLQFMKAKLLWRKKKYEETSYLIENINFETVSEIHRNDYLSLKAKNFEKFKKFDEAFACCTQNNLLVKESKEYPKHNPEQYFQNLRDSLDKLKSSSRMNSKASSVENPEFSPIFLVGFPRSGTTLLDTILRSNSKIEVVEEKGMLSAAERFLRKNGHNVLAGELVPSQLNLEAQKIYRREFNKYINTTLADKVYIDKLPLNLLQASLIHQIYPAAKFILALRHPMDSILSCWMQNFSLNSAMANMVDLDRIVEFYCIAMETFTICRTNNNLNVHEIRYEDLINNFQEESEAVLQFLNLRWEPEMENYPDTAIKRGRINTPSYSQVVQPIYKESLYRWLNYQKHLEKYLKQVKPWISEFGYD